MNRKIGLITFHRANNYGAFLQCYATQQVLSRYYPVEVIDYKNRKLESSFDLIRLGSFSLRGIAGFVKDICRIIPRRKVVKKFQKEIDEKLNKTKRLDTGDLVYHFNHSKYYAVFVGSDQVWNPGCYGDDGLINELFLLSCVEGETKKVSYASSFGSYILDKRNKEILKEELTKFQAVSVREEKRKLELERFIDQNVAHTLDPTLLLTEREWLTYFPKATKRVELLSKEKYILYYSVPKTKLSRDLLKSVKEKYGYKIVSIDQDIFPFYNAEYKIRDCGIDEFINLFSNASIIVTDSFHGVCFSIIFKKLLFVASPGLLSNRITSLLKLISLEACLYEKNDLTELDEVKIRGQIESSNEVLEIERNRSINYIENSLRNE